MDSQIFLLTSEGLLCVFYHKYRKAIQHEARPDQSGASIFGFEILGLHFQTLSLILLLIGPAFPGTDTDPIRHKVNTPAWFNQRDPLNDILSMSRLCPCLPFVQKSWKMDRCNEYGVQMQGVVEFAANVWQNLEYTLDLHFSVNGCLLAPPFLPFAQINYLLFAHPTHQANQSP